MKAIGIDIGTTSICGILLDCKTGDVIKSVTKNSEAFIKTNNEWEKIQDVEKIVKTALEITEELYFEDVSVIGVTGQMHGIVYYDENGKAVSPLYTWQDTRGNLMYKDNKTYSEFLGYPAGYGFVTDFYNRENNIRPKEAVGFATIHDYFAMVLTGRKIAKIHSSDGASFGCYNLEKNEFECDFYGEISNGFDIIGKYKNAKVSVAIGDNQASVFGATSSDNDILLNIGTGSQISVISNEIIKTSNTEVRPYTDNNYLIVGAALCGGRAFSMLEKFFSKVVFLATGKQMSMYEVMDKMVLEGENHIVADTRFGGTRKDITVTGSINNITTENFTPEEFKYSILNGIISELYNMFSEINVSGKTLVGSGNGLRLNKELIEAAEKMFGVKMRIPKHLEEAAFGSALFAMVASNEFGSISDIKGIIKYE